MLVTEHICIRLDNPVAVLWLIYIDTAVQLEAVLKLESNGARNSHPYGTAG